MKRLTVIIFLFISSSFKSSAGNELYGLWNYEREFSFVKVDCANDSMYVLNQLPNFYYTPNFSSCFDNVRMKYYLCFGQNMQVIDALTGSVDTTYTFNFINPKYFIHTVFNPIDGFIYGLKWDIGTLQERFAKFDPATASFTDIGPVLVDLQTGAGCKSSIDPYLGQYYLQSRSLNAIRISDGQLLYSNPIITQTNVWFDHLAYSCDQRKLFGLTNNYHSVLNYFAALDTNNGATTKVNLSPLNTYFYKQYFSGSTVDNLTETYYYSANSNLYGVDINTGAVVYSHYFGEGQFLFLESASSFDCTVLEVEENTRLQINVFPNPSSEVFYFNLADFGNCDVQIKDMNGRVVLSKHLMQNDASVDLKEFTQGVYIYEIRNRLKLNFGKLILK